MARTFFFFFVLCLSSCSANQTSPVAHVVGATSGPSPLASTPAPALVLTCPAPFPDVPLLRGRNLGTATYDKLVEKHALLGIARAEAFVDWLGAATWNVNIADATLTVTGRGVFPIRVLGTFSKVSKTFLWSWANTAITTCKPKAYALELRTSALDDSQLTPFVERKIAEGWVPYQELAAVVSDMAGLASFEAPFGDGIAVLLVENGQNRPVLTPSLVERVVDLLDRVVVVAPKRYELVANFLVSGGYVVTRTSPSRLDAHQSTDRISVEWHNGMRKLPAGKVTR